MLNNLLIVLESFKIIFIMIGLSCTGAIIFSALYCRRSKNRKIMIKDANKQNYIL